MALGCRKGTWQDERHISTWQWVVKLPFWTRERSPGKSNITGGLLCSKERTRKVKTSYKKAALEEVALG